MTMKRISRTIALMLGMLFLFGAQTGCSQSAGWSAVDSLIQRNFPEVEQISTDSLALLLADEPKLILLDTRPEEEYAVSHLPGALRVDPGAESFPALDSLRRDTPIVAYCSVGYRSSEIAQRLKAAGFTNVSNLQGSIFRWANEGRSIYRGDEQVQQVHPYDRVWGRLLDKDLRAYSPEG